MLAGILIIALVVCVILIVLGVAHGERQLNVGRRSTILSLLGRCEEANEEMVIEALFSKKRIGPYEAFVLAHLLKTLKSEGLIISSLERHGSPEGLREIEVYQLTERGRTNYETLCGRVATPVLA
jgi:hypothetical protein